MKYFLSWILSAGAILLLFPVTAQNTVRNPFAPDGDDFPVNFPQIHALSYSKGELLEGFCFRLLAVSELPDHALRATLEREQGIRFLQYYPHQVYLMALPAGLDPQVLRVLQPIGLLPEKAEWKCAKNLLEPPFGDWAVHGDAIDVNVQVRAMLSQELGEQLLRRQGLTILKSGNQNGFFQLRIPTDEVLAVAALPFVQYLELAPPPGEPEDEKGRAMQRANLLDAAAPGGSHWNGSGVKVLVRDDGPVGPHIDFQGRLNNLSPLSPPWDVNHSDRVMGALAGAGNLDPQSEGIAAGASLYNIQYASDFQDATLDLHLNEGISITNSSYSNGCNSGYTLITQTVDQQLFEHPTLMHVFSAGNEGTSNCNYGAGSGWGNITGGHKLGKNTLVVANLRANQLISNSSSRGPATDGRLKPEISALGTAVLMPSADNTYATSSGTSFSSPAAAGALAQLTQAFRETYNVDPPAALLKAAVMNTANDLGNPGPDFIYGFGLLNAYKSWQLLQAGNWQEAAVDQGGQNLHQIDVPPGVNAVKVMLYWTDPPAAPNSAKALVNDLDLLATGNAGAIYQPLVLNPAASAATLNLPAVQGRDSLNNVEQIVVLNPGPGILELQVNGFEVPIGPQSYYVLWYFETDTVSLSYPAGGESFSPGQNIQVSWDAFGVNDAFNLSYSSNNGQTWSPVATVSAEIQKYDWTLPNLVSGKMLFAISRGSYSDTTQIPFSIAPVPGGIQFDTVCPDYMRLSWNPVSDTLQYQVYLLGDQYMDLKAVTDTTVYSIPFFNDGTPQWLAVAVADSNGLQGRRSLAVAWPGGLKNCPQSSDLALQQLSAPGTDAVLSCATVNQIVSVQCRNEGQLPASGALVSYQMNNEAIHTEVLPDLDPGASLDYSFQAPLALTQNGLAQLRVWCDFPGDLVFYNDTLQTSFSVVTVPETNLFIQDFEGPLYPPSGWTVVNPDGVFAWESSFEDLIGENGQAGTAMLVDCYNYSTQNQEDYLYLPPVDFTNLPSAALRFAWSHAQYNDTYEETLRLEAFPGCDLNQTPLVLWSKTDPELATAAATTTRFLPEAMEDWQADTVNLSAFAGQTLILRFVAVNDYGNTLLLDNVQLLEQIQIPPTGTIALASDSLCVGESLTVFLQASGDSLEYHWMISNQNGSDTLSGPGPFTLSWPVAGMQTIQCALSNPFGEIMVSTELLVLDPPQANFSAMVDGLSMTFSNTSLGANTWFWDFGDGQTSTEANPVHVYTEQGVYTIRLTVTNACGESIYESTVPTLSGTTALQNALGVVVSPNPSNGRFRLTLTLPESGSLMLSLQDALGRTVFEQATTRSAGRQTMDVEPPSLPAGIYQLQVRTTLGGIQVPVVIAD
ncbi:MAG: S8 family serine peptidase [Lewinellaceae bacterium]|nr:S8 family serine peptidase [Lewinellaceae bacterium]